MNGVPELHDGGVCVFRDEACHDWFRDPDEAQSLSQSAIDWLIAQGVGIAAIADFGAPPEVAFTVGAARVQLQPSGRYVPLQGLGDFAFVLPCISSAGIIDLAAWQPGHGRIGTRLGIAGLIGEIEVEDAADDVIARPVMAWRSPLEWLRAGRSGIVLVDGRIAAHRLSGINVVPQDTELGHALRMLRVPPPRVLRPRSRWPLQRRLAA